jgi:2-keto-3-deoxy-L-rhamnonate aldolase RhmA
LIALAEYINNNTMIFPQTERLETISNLPNILNLPGVTGTLVGPYDLAWDIGGIDPRALGSEVVTTKFMSEKLKQIGKMCKDAGKVAGIGGLPIEDYAGWAKEGYQVFILGYAIDGNVDELRQKIETVRASMS